jgi:hypothetical protein
MKKSLKNSVNNGYKLKVSAVMNTVDSENPISITPDDIQQNSFNIDRYVQTGNTFEIGSVCASELKFVLYNKDKFKSVIFEGAEVIVSGTIPVENSDGEWLDTTVNLGSFTIDEKPKSQSLIQIVALDDMVKFDKPCNVSGTGTIKALVSFLASQCGVSVDEDSLNTCFNAYSNITVTLTLPADTDYLCRQVLSWLCQLALCNAYINVDGKLAFKTFTGSSVDTITADDRYSHTIEEKEIGVKELVYKDGETKETIVRWSDTATRDKCISLDFSDNPLFKEFYTQLKEKTDLFDAWKSKVSTFYYVPFSANIRNFFWLEPMDKITFNKDGINYDTWIMHTTLCPGNAMKLEAKGECKTKSGYASMNPLTAQEQKFLNDLRKFVTTETAKVTPREYQLIEFNKAINAGMAMYQTTVNGITYYHDRASLEDSDYILVQNGAGVAWTDNGWNNGSPVWEYGFSSDGEAILSSLDAYSIRADLLTVTDLKAFNATIGNWHIGDDMLYCGGSQITTERWEVGSYSYGYRMRAGKKTVSTAYISTETEMIECQQGDVFYYTGSATSAAPGCFVYDEDEKLITYLLIVDLENFALEITEENAKYVIFQSAIQSGNPAENNPPLIVTRDKPVPPSYTFFKSATSPSDVVWASGAESLESYDSAGFLLYGDGRVRMGGNTDEGYILAWDNTLQFCGGDDNQSAQSYFSLGLSEGYDKLSFIGWQDNSHFEFHSGYRRFLDISYENGIIKTNYWSPGFRDAFAGLQHYRIVGANTVHSDFGVGNQNGTPSVALEVYRIVEQDDKIFHQRDARLDVYKNPSENGQVNLRLANTDTNFTPLRFAVNAIYYDGDITANGVNLNESAEDLQLRVGELEATVKNIEDFLMKLGG